MSTSRNMHRMNEWIRFNYKLFNYMNTISPAYLQFLSLTTVFFQHTVHFWQIFQVRCWCMNTVLYDGGIEVRALLLLLRLLSLACASISHFTLICIQFRAIRGSVAYVHSDSLSLNDVNHLLYNFSMCNTHFHILSGIRSLSLTHTHSIFEFLHWNSQINLNELMNSNENTPCRRRHHRRR